MRLRSALLAFFLAAIWLPGQSPKNGRPIGHVVSVAGVWRDRTFNNSKVDVGYAIYTRSRIVRQSRSKSASRLTARLAATGKAETFDCAAIDCAGPLDIQARIPKDEPASQIGMFLRAAYDVMRENLGSGHIRTMSGYARAMSHGAASVVIADAIVSLHDGRPDISAMLTGVEAGTYLIEFCRVDQSGAFACPDIPETEEFQWKADGKPALSSRAMQPSLYEMFLCRRQGDRVFRRESAFVLAAATEQKAEQMRTESQEFRKLMDGWSEKEVSMLQHAYLQHLNLTENR